MSNKEPSKLAKTIANVIVVVISTIFIATLIGLSARYIIIPLFS